MGDDVLLGSWERSLRARNLSRATIDSYLSDCRNFVTYLEAEGRDLLGVTRHHLRDYFARLLDEGKAGATVARRYRSLQQFYKWATEEEEIDRNPMERMSPPAVAVTPPPVISTEVMETLLATCRRNARPPKGDDGQTDAALRRRRFEATRDLAMILVLARTGMRSGELIGIRLGDLHLSGEMPTVTISGKTGTRNVLLLDDAAEAVDRYLRVRRRHAQAQATDALWIGDRGRLTDSGLRQMLERRCADAGVPPINPHRFRHTFAHEAKTRGVPDHALMSFAGWKSPQMLVRYGASAAEQASHAVIRDAFGKGK